MKAGFTGMTLKQSTSSQLNTASSRPKKTRQAKSNVKTMLIAFFYIDVLVHHEYVPGGYWVKREFYKRIKQRLRDAVRGHRPEKWRSGNWILHHENPPPTGLLPQMNFWRKTTFRCFNTLPTPLILLRATPFPGTEENNEMSLIRLH